MKFKYCTVKENKILEDLEYLEDFCFNFEKMKTILEKRLRNINFKKKRSADFKDIKYCESLIIKINFFKQFSKKTKLYLNGWLY